MGLLIAAIPWPGFAEARPASISGEVGSFYLQSFGPEDYEAHAQNWSLVQGTNDFIYVGNGDGVLEYDGVSWRLMPVSNRSAVRSLALGPEGQVFVGAAAELGYLAPDPQGRMHYVSLVDRIAAEDRRFADVWRMATTSAGVFFMTAERLFRWDGQEMKVWRAETRFGLVFALRDVLYTSQQSLGLMRMEDDSLVTVSGSGVFADGRLIGLEPWGDEAYLAITEGRGLFQCQTSPEDETSCTPVNPGLTERLAELQPFDTAIMPDGRLAIATRRGGALLLARDGRLLRVLNEASGLRNEAVWCVYPDRQGGLWLTLNDGLVRVETGGPMSFWRHAAKTAGPFTRVARHRGRLHASTFIGVSRLAPGSDGATPRFLSSPGVSGQCWSLLSTPQGLLAGCHHGLYNLDLQQQIWALDDRHVFAIAYSRRHPTVLYLGLSDGLARLRLRNGQWTEDGRFAEVQSKVRNLVEDDQGRLWLGTVTDGLIGVELQDDHDRRNPIGRDPIGRDPVGRDPIITRFGTGEGLPIGLIETRLVAGRLVIFSDDGSGLFRLGSDQRAFVPDTTFDAFLPRGSGSIRDLKEDDQGRVWIAAGMHSGVAHPAAEGGYTWAPTALRRAPIRDVFGIHIETEGPLWLLGPHGLIRYDTGQSLETPDSYPVHIRRVTTSTGTLLTQGRPGDTPAERPYEDNSLRFAFAAPRYDAPQRTRYRVRLEGSDDDWSTWSDESFKDYTNLWEGRYVLRVQAQDVYGFLSQEDTFAFRILPPWYRSGWAYTLYALALVAVIAGAVRYSRDRLQRERAVNARLREVDKLKDEFLANTSHELRTPLYGMTGIVESLIDGATGELPAETRQNLEMVVASGRRLSHLVGDILDFSKLRHKSLELDRRPVELHALVDVVLTLSASLVGSKDLRLINAVAPDLPAADADENRLQQILYNLIGNAIKFTEQGHVKVSAALEGDRLVVRVTDTGIGIAAEQREQIFEAFEQADASIERQYGGTGLGLALTRQLVELHGGTVGVESTPGEGSTFSFSLEVAAGATTAAESAASTPAAAVLPDTARGTAPDAAPDAVPTASGGASGGGPRVLVVDDEPVNLQVVRNYLAVEEFNLTLASSGEQALQLLEEKTFDLVLLDVMMPRLSGYEVCRSLREKHSLSDLPVIFLTAKSQDADVVTGMALGANDYLMKPISKDRLLARVRPHLELLDAHRHLEDRVEEKMAQVKVLSGLLPICVTCKKIRDDEGYWSQLELFIDQHSEARFSHGICPECLKQTLAELPQRKPQPAS